MFDGRSYQLGFDVWGLVLFLVIMLPNAIWFAVPAPNDVLRNASVTPTADGIAQVLQVLMTAALCFIVNVRRERPMSRKYKTAVSLSAALYFGGWVLYYTGMTNPFVILVLCIAPCAAFLLFSAARRNLASLVFAGAFMVCHLLYGIVNFIG